MVDGVKVSEFQSVLGADVALTDLTYLILASGTDRDKKITVQALRDALVRLIGANAIDWSKVSKSSASPGDVGADAAGTASAAVATHAASGNPHSQLQSAINAKQDLSSRLSAIAAAAAPASPKLTQLGTNGAIAFVDIGAKENLSPLQTTWTLTGIPAMPHLSNFFINGQKQTYGTDYVINGGLVTWQGYTLKSHWKIEIYYT